MPKGRPTKPRTTELGRYLESERLARSWLLRDLADASGIAYRTLSRIELGKYPLRHPGLLMKLASALELHPNKLLLKAALTPYLSPERPMPSLAEWVGPLNGTEKALLDIYLDFIRYLAITDRIQVPPVPPGSAASA